MSSPNPHHVDFPQTKIIPKTQSKPYKYLSIPLLQTSQLKNTQPNMALSKAFTSLLLLPLLLLPLASAATFTVTNKCTYTVWAAAVPGGGRRLDPNQSWTLNVAAGTTGARIWGRTGCSFDSSGHGNCQTGDCGGLLACTASASVSPPVTLAEFSLNQNGGQDFYDISLVDGFNIPMDFSPTSGNCHDIRCTADINRQCPAELKAPGGCNNPCTVFKTNKYCCTSGGCGPTGYSKFFKKNCPDAYSYPEDDAASTFTCPSGVDYWVVFCPAADPEVVVCGVTNN